MEAINNQGAMAPAPLANEPTPQNAAAVNVTATITDEQMQAIADKAGKAAANAIADRHGLAKTAEEAGARMMATLIGTRPEDLKPEEAAFLDELKQSTERKLLQEGSVVLVKTNLSPEQKALLSRMSESRRTTTRITGLPNMGEFLDNAMLQALIAESKSLYNAGKFSKAYGIDYSEFKKAFSL